MIVRTYPNWLELLLVLFLGKGEGNQRGKKRFNTSKAIQPKRLIVVEGLSIKGEELTAPLKVL